MFLIVGVWGSRERKILASYYFFLYTLLGSVMMLLSILYIYYQVGTTDYEVLLNKQISFELGKGELTAHFLYQYQKEIKVNHNLLHPSETDPYLLSSTSRAPLCCTFLNLLSSGFDYQR